MKQLRNMFATLQRWWREAPARSRLAIGAILVAIIGVMGLTPNVIFGQTLIWPYAGIIAAAGWGRSGLAFAPMVLLVFFGIAQDVTGGAPIGCFALVNILVFGASAGLSQTFDMERSPGMNFAVPVMALAIGFILVWILASLSGGYIARAAPLISAFFATLFAHVVLSGLFDLGVRRGQARGVMA